MTNPVTDDGARAETASGAYDNAHYVEYVSGYTVANLYGRMNPAQRDALVRFWRDNGAIPDESEARRRTEEVVHLVLDGYGRVAGVNTCYPASLNNAQNGAPPYMFYRQYVHPQARGIRISLALVRLTVDYFANLYRQGAGPKGIAMYLENPKLYDRSGRRALEWLKMNLAEKLANGAEVWTRDF